MFVMKHEVYAGKVHVEIKEDIIVALSFDNIMDWIADCDDPDMLEKIGRKALKLSSDIRNNFPNDDSWRSHA